MRVLICSPYFPPQHAVASLRVHSFACAMAEAGHDVTVLTTAKRDDQAGMPMPHRNINVVELAYDTPRPLEWLRRQDRTRTAVAAPRPDAARDERAIMTWLRRWKERTGVFSSLRMPDLTDAWVRPAVMWATDHGPWDLVLSSSGPYTAHLVALAVRSSGSASYWVADFRDLWTRNHACRGVFPFTVRERQLERQCLRAADLVVTVSEGLAEALRTQRARRVETIYNGYDENDWTELDPAPTLPSDRINLVYAGTLHDWGQDPSPILAGLQQLAARNPALVDACRLVVCGASGGRWRRHAARYEVEHLLEDHGLLDRRDALRMQRDAQALLAIEWHAPEQGVLTGKLFEYLRAGPPIFVIGGTTSDPIGHLVEQTGRGEVWGRAPERIAKRLEEFLNQRAAANTAPREPALIETFTRQRQAQRLMSVIGNR